MWKSPFAARAPTSPQLINRQVETQLRQANRNAGRDIAKVGVKATKLTASGCPTFVVSAQVRRSRTHQARADGATVEIYGSPAGCWTILDSGARPHRIAPRKAKVLRLGADMFYDRRQPSRHGGSRCLAPHRGPVDAGDVR